MRYSIRLIINEYTRIGEDYKPVEVITDFNFYCWDDVQNFIGYMVDGRGEKGVKFEIRVFKEEE